MNSLRREDPTSRSHDLIELISYAFKINSQLHLKCFYTRFSSFSALHTQSLKPDKL
jgi:hypothetical protein